MKLLALLAFIALSCAVSAQKSMFIRVYNEKGQKIAKGKVIEARDSILTIGDTTKPELIPVSTIGYIKTRHSAGNNILIGTVTGAGIGGIFGAFSGGSDGNDDSGAITVYGSSAGESIGTGIIVGIPIGFAVGGITALFKNTHTFNISGDYARWKEFQDFIAPYTRGMK